MKFNVGQTIRHKITQQQGRVMRVADTSIGAVYVMLIALGERWGETTKEVIWRESEVRAVLPQPII